MGNVIKFPGREAKVNENLRWLLGAVTIPADAKSADMVVENFPGYQQGARPVPIVDIAEWLGLISFPPASPRDPWVRFETAERIATAFGQRGLSNYVFASRMLMPAPAITLDVTRATLSLINTGAWGRAYLVPETVVVHRLRNLTLIP